MIEIANLDREFWWRSVREPGGFCWWYLDLTNASGDGLVLIWALGLPFLAGSREGVPAAQRPALNLSLYRGGRTEFYLLQEYAEDQVALESPEGTARLGRSRIEVSNAGSEMRVSVLLDEAVPGTAQRLEGRIDLQGPALRCGSAAAEAKHLWTPRVLHGRAQATIAVGDCNWELSGHGYFDGNASPYGLHAQGIGSWRWGRVTAGDRSLVYYDVLPDSASMTDGHTIVLEAAADGSTREWIGADLLFSAEKTGIYGLQSPRRLEIVHEGTRIECTMQRLVDDGPFYQRYLVTASGAWGHGHGVYEVVRPDRLDLTWQRPFVRMRTHRLAGPNSTWLPLFSGPRRGRTRRLIQSWLRGVPA